MHTFFESSICNTEYESTHSTKTKVFDIFSEYKPEEDIPSDENSGLL